MVLLSMFTMLSTIMLKSTEFQTDSLTTKGHNTCFVDSSGQCKSSSQNCSSLLKSFQRATLRSSNNRGSLITKLKYLARPVLTQGACLLLGKNPTGDPLQGSIIVDQSSYFWKNVFACRNSLSMTSRCRGDRTAKEAENGFGPSTKPSE